jgi:hypothetical protein
MDDNLMPSKAAEEKKRAELDRKNEANRTKFEDCPNEG